jgi:TonB family protein
MNSLATILLQSSLSIVLLYLVYFLFLRKDTFFKTNRFYLIISLVISAVVPFVDFTQFLPNREGVLLVLLDPIIITPEGIQNSVEANSELFNIGLSIYLTGIVIFTLRFIYQLFQIFTLITRFGISRKQGLRIVFTNKNFSPFSFFNLVFLDQNNIESPEYQKIIAHERVHIRQWHSLDLLILEIITIFLWFNPFVWLYRHAVKTLHEYLADEGVLHSGVDAKVYSALLFEQSTGIQINDLTNNFSKSLLKRRFTMMTKSRSKQIARAKLLFALPLALSMLLLISFSPDIIAQQEEKAAAPKQTEKVVTKQGPEDPPPPPKPQDEVPIFTVVEVMPKYPGGNDAMYAFLGENIKYPEKAQKEGISGRVYVTFVVEKDGSVSNVEVLRGAEASLDKEALRVVKLMPKWEPGTQKGKPVRVQYNLPIKFSLNKEKEVVKPEEQP